MGAMYVVGGATELVVSWLLGLLDVTRDELVKCGHPDKHPYSRAYLRKSAIAKAACES